jgi:PBP1b-binding outer membrane lipoprotein LpoB
MSLLYSCMQEKNPIKHYFKKIENNFKNLLRQPIKVIPTLDQVETMLKKVV